MRPRRLFSQLFVQALHAQLRARVGEAVEGLGALCEIRTALETGGELRNVNGARVLWRLADAAALAGDRETAQAAAREGAEAASPTVPALADARSPHAPRSARQSESSCSSVA
jgi:hypothetical protein